MRPYSTLFLALLLLAGCGDSGGSDDSTSSGSGGTASGSGGGSSGGSSGSSGGSSGSGGSSSGGSSSGTGGSDSGGVRAAVSLHVVPSAGCSLGELTLDFPVIAAGNPVTATDKTGTIGDGETTADGNAASVVCTWLPAQPSPNVLATVTLGSGASQRYIDVGAVMAEGQPVDANIVVRAPELPSNYRGTCTLTPIEVNAATHSVWGEITCDSFEPFDGEDSCTIGPSYYVFENCSPP